MTRLPRYKQRTAGFVLEDGMRVYPKVRVSPPCICKEIAIRFPRDVRVVGSISYGKRHAFIEGPMVVPAFDEVWLRSNQGDWRIA